MGPVGSRRLRNTPESPPPRVASGRLEGTGLFAGAPRQPVVVVCWRWDPQNLGGVCTSDAQEEAAEGGRAVRQVGRERQLVGLGKAGVAGQWDGAPGAHGHGGLWLHCLLLGKGVPCEWARIQVAAGGSGMEFGLLVRKVGSWEDGGVAPCVGWAAGGPVAGRQEAECPRG